MQTIRPSSAQLDVYARRSAHRPVVLFYRFDCGSEADGAQLVGKLATLARGHRGRVRWCAVEEQALIGPVSVVRHCARVHFRSRSDALALVRSAAHEALFADARTLEVGVIGEQPRASAIVVRLMALALPHWPFFDNAIDSRPEPGIGSSSVMPTQAAYDSFLSHPDPMRPLVMINWLRFRERAQYAEDESTDREPVSGQAAYYRYGRIAFLALHSLGARALFLGRYQQILIGNGGDPGVDQWHEFVLVEYPGRAAFKRMTSLQRYRAGLHHRAAGLVENGQGLVVTAAIGCTS
jgi:hypothetical protein